MSFSCTDKDTLIAYVYGECDATTRGVVEAHLAACPACAGEVGGFGKVREMLSKWSPPERAGGFRLVRQEEADAPAPAKVVRPARWWQMPLPALARVAAAVLLFAGGAALANLDVRYDKDGFVVRTGWQKSAPVATPVAVGQPVTTEYPVAPAQVPTSAIARRSVQDDSPWRVELASLERRLRDEFHQQLAATRVTNAAASPMKVSADVDENRLMTRVRALIDESYRRQQIEMAYRISLFERDYQAQRKADLVRVQQTFGQLEGAPPSLQEQRQMMNYIRLNPVSLKK
ncbi:MAG TPA: zf-HC2 domain-containing protein [Vicinamibacterales bacterium]